MTYMDTREGQFLKHIAPEHFTEVYKRVQNRARDKHQELIDRVEKYEKLHKSYLKIVKNGLSLYGVKNYEIDLNRAKEHLERFVNANADYLI